MASKDYEKNDKYYAQLEQRIEQVALIMHRLNNMWSFTGAQLSYACDNYMRPRQLATLEERVYTLVQAYAALTKSVTLYTSQGYALPDFWDRTFGKLGQDVVFTLPEMGNRLQLVAEAKAANPTLKIFVRARHARERQELEQLGVTGICFEEAEAAVSLGRLILESEGVEREAIRRQTTRIRQIYHRDHPR
jgi:hypothetical protein